MKKTTLSAAVLIMAVAVLTSVVHARQAANAFLGQWNITGVAPDTNYVYWLELKQENGKLTSLFLNRTGHPLPLTAMKIENNELIFQAGGTAEKPTGPEFHAKVVDGKLVGSVAIPVRVPTPGNATIDRSMGASQAQAAAGAPQMTTRTVNFAGVRPPVWPAANANGAHTYGTPVVLYDQTMKDKDPATLFDVQNTRSPINWLIEDGLLTNKAPGGNNIISKQKFTDFKVRVEYKLEAKSNSGIYLRGRYELQVLDDINDTTTEKFLTQAAIYGRRAPDVLASKAPGEWQVMEAVMVANKVTVTLNGKTVHNNQPVVGITGGALDNDELAPGPLMIQGDHNRIWIRSLVVTPITKAGK